MEGGAAGGLAGTNTGDGDPDLAEIEDSLGSSESDRFEDDPLQGEPPFAGRSGGAVGGTPAEKRVKGGRLEGHGTADRNNRGQGPAGQGRKSSS
jgi:hypothetical protein